MRKLSTLAIFNLSPTRAFVEWKFSEFAPRATKLFSGKCVLVGVRGAHFWNTFLVELPIRVKDMLGYSLLVRLGISAIQNIQGRNLATRPHRHHLCPAFPSDISGQSWPVPFHLTPGSVLGVMRHRAK
jgi:hypothetical protein